MRVRTYMNATEITALAAIVTMMCTGWYANEKIPIMHWTLLYTGMRYNAVFVGAPSPNIAVMPISMTMIMRGITEVAASLTVFENAETTEINEIKIKIVERIIKSNSA